MPQRTEWTAFGTWLGWIALGVMAASVLAGLAGGVWAWVTSNPMDAWRGLVAFAAAVVVGLAGGALAGLVGVVLLVRRFAPPGRRVAVLGWTLVVVVGLLLVGTVADLVVRESGLMIGGLRTIGAVAVVAVVTLVTPVVVLGIRERSRMRATGR